MKRLKLFISLVMLSALTITVGCKKDNSNPQAKAPEFHTKTVSVPDAMSQSDDPGAQQAAGYINMVNSMAAFGSFMSPPGKSTRVTGFKDGGGDVYVWEINEGDDHFTITLTVTETETEYYWKVVIDGTLNGNELDNFLYIESKEAKDGSDSQMTVYDPDGSGVLMTLSWYKEGNTYHFTYEIPFEVQITMVVYEDGSGNMEVKEWSNGAWILGFKTQWDASGHGQWWIYDDGVLADQGSW